MNLDLGENQPMGVLVRESVGIVATRVIFSGTASSVKKVGITLEMVEAS